MVGVSKRVGGCMTCRTRKVKVRFCNYPCQYKPHGSENAYVLCVHGPADIQELHSVMGRFLVLLARSKAANANLIRGTSSLSTISRTNTLALSPAVPMALFRHGPRHAENCPICRLHQITVSRILSSWSACLLMVLPLQHGNRRM